MLGLIGSFSVQVAFSSQDFGSVSCDAKASVFYVFVAQNAQVLLAIMNALNNHSF